MPEREPPEKKTVATNRRARHDYEITDTYEAGISLVGSEVKTLRQGKASLQDAYAVVRNGEVFVYGMHIPPYPQASIQNHDPVRTRKLLLHAKEIAKIATKTNERGFTLIPMRLYFKGNKVKLELGVGRGKAKYDKREAIIAREAKREMERREGARRRAGPKRR